MATVTFRAIRGGSAWAVFAAAALALGGCSSKAAAPASSCVPVANGCAGVPDGDVCGGDTCTDGVACASVVAVSDDASLAAAAGQAASGSCIALRAGSYAGVVLPGGVSLLGKGASSVTIGSVEAKAGSGAVIRGMSIGSGGLLLDDDVVAARVDSVRVAGTLGNGITLGVRGAATIESVWLDHVGWGSSTTTPAGQGYAIYASGAASLTVQKTRVTDSAGPGLWLQSCKDGCACATPTSVTATGIIIEGSQLVGASLSGVKGSLQDVSVASTTPFWKSGEQGGGVSIAQCSDVTTTALHVSNNQLYGLLIDHSSAQIGDASTPQGIIIEGNQAYGVWVQNIGQWASGLQAVSLSGAVVRGNSGVGIGVDGGSRGIIIEGSSVEGTAMKSMPVSIGQGAQGQNDVGDGLSWMQGSQLVIKSLALSGNARAGALFAGQWGGGSSANLQLGDGNAHGIIIEGVDASSTPPGLQSVDPSQITRSANFAFPAALGPAAPVAMN